MKKQDLLQKIDEDLLEKLTGFCYVRTNDSYEAEELCAEILFALVKAAQKEGDILNDTAFLWKVARNVYADYSEKRKFRSERHADGDPEELLLSVPSPASEDGLYNTYDILEKEDRELLAQIYRRIAFLTKAYREVMIRFYLDGCSTAQIAKELDISEISVRQRLFAAREKIKKEVKNMSEQNEIKNRPIALEKLNFDIIGNGDPASGDPRDVCTREFSRHIVWLCKKKARTASEIAEILNIPTMYVEEELEIQTNGTNGKYGLLRRPGQGKYMINFILLDPEEFETISGHYQKQIPQICDEITNFIKNHEKEYLAFPYRNHTWDLNLIIWQQLVHLIGSLRWSVQSILKNDYFAEVPPSNRPFTVFGHTASKYLDLCNGWDAFGASNLCGYRHICFSNIYQDHYIRAHFHCGHNASTDPLLQLAIRAIDGLPLDTLSETEKEHAAKALQCGYLLKEDNILYTKILVNEQKDDERLFSVSDQLSNESGMQEIAARIAEGLAADIKKILPDYLLEDWNYAVNLANIPVYDNVVSTLIEKGILTPPQDGIGAEGCWMSVSK